MTSATEQRLLEAAGQTFAEKGFERATVREICKRAEANVAAINYHFGDKLGLYRAVLLDVFAKVCADDGGSIVSSEASSDAVGRKEGEAPAPPEARLRGFVLTRLRTCRPAEDGGWQEKLVSREMAEPTQALEDVVRLAILPLSRRLIGVVRELLGEPPAPAEPIRPGSTDFGDSPEAVLCSISVIGQILHHHHSKHVISRLFPQLTYSPEQMETLADHVTAFSLAGIAAVRRARERRGMAPPDRPENSDDKEP